MVDMVDSNLIALDWSSITNSQLRINTIHVRTTGGEIMDKPVSQSLKNIFLIHAILSVLVGVGLWLIPGRFLTFAGWVPEIVEMVVLETVVQAPGTFRVDPFITRAFGAALLALAYSSYLGWRSRNWEQVALIVKSEAVFCILALTGFIASLMIRISRNPRPITEQLQNFPVVGWVEMIVLAGFALAWIWALRAHTKT